MFRSKTARGSLLLSGCLALLPGVTRAEAPAAPTSEEATTDEARGYFMAGNKALADQDWSAAEAAFRKAWGLSKSYDVAGNLGQAVLKLGRAREAAELLSYSLRNAPPSAKPAARAHTTELLALAKKEIVTVRLTVNAPIAAVVVDGRPIESAMLHDEVYVDPGTRTLAVSAEGYQAAKITIDAKAGEARQESLQLVPLVPARPSVAPLVTLGALAVTGLGVGIGAAVAANDKAAAAANVLADIRAASGPCNSATPAAACATLLDLRRDQRDLENGAFWSFVGAGVAGAGAAVYWLVALRGMPPKKALTVTPTAGATFGGVEVNGTW